MKKTLLLSLLVPFFGNTQISLTEANFATADEWQGVSEAAIDQGIDYQSTGADMLWDFTTITPNAARFNEYNAVANAGSIAQFTFGTFASASHKASYYAPNTTLPLGNLPAQVPIQITDINSFMKLDASALKQVGYTLVINGQGIPAKSDTIETFYSFPVEFEDTLNSRGYTKLDLNPVQEIIWIQHRGRTSIVDGWGTVITPNGSFDALRIHHKIKESDSINITISGFNVWLPINVPLIHEYEWRSTSEKEFVMKITTSGNTGNENVTKIEYKDAYYLGLAANEIELNMYPNPTNEVLQINSKESIQFMEIYSVDGKLVYSEQVNAANSMHVDVKNLPSGNYQLAVHFASSQVPVRKAFVKF